MTRTEAYSHLDGRAEVDYVLVGDIFSAFGFHSATPSFEIEVYYHPRFRRCGKFTARDEGHRTLSPCERDLIRRMVSCVELHEMAERGDQSEIGG